MRLSSVLPTLAAAGMGMAAPTELEQGQDANFKREMLAAHNFFRGQHSADPLSWNPDLAKKGSGLGRHLQLGPRCKSAPAVPHPPSALPTQPTHVY
ncbi:hypothetical protein J3459_011288 [Metarhizium acridum]|nr:hypothetical protein J3459_011288 [Metarhizium acridum]